MPPALFPCITRSCIENCQFSSWYHIFSDVCPKATIIRPLSTEFRGYLEEDGVLVPEGSEDFIAKSSLSDTSSSDDEEAEDLQSTRPTFPQLDAQIRDAITRYEAVFPKLNWTSPKDASWVVPTLKCTSPADVYLLLKSSDFVSHDLDPLLAFEGCTSFDSCSNSSPCAVDGHAMPPHELELVLKKWYLIDRAREFRCFVRDEILLAIAQRDPNYYPHLNEQSIKNTIVHSVSEFWENSVKAKFKGGDYIFDICLTRDLSSAHIVDFNPYHPKTDSLLFTYDELLQLLISASGVALDLPPDCGPWFPPVLRTITSPSHPATSRNAPTNQHNAIPFDVLHMSSGNDMATFSKIWEERLKSDANDE